MVWRISLWKCQCILSMGRDKLRGSAQIGAYCKAAGFLVKFKWKCFSQKLHWQGQCPNQVWDRVPDSRRIHWKRNIPGADLRWNRQKHCKPVECALHHRLPDQAGRDWRWQGAFINTKPWDKKSFHKKNPRMVQRYNCKWRKDTWTILQCICG